MDELRQLMMFGSVPSHCTPLRWMGSNCSDCERSSKGILHRNLRYTINYDDEKLVNKIISSITGFAQC